MNFYPFHIGDYATHTAHLEPMEDLAYRRLMDQYYLREKPLPADIAEVARLIRMRQHPEAVEAVLREFFTLTDAGWLNERCEAELSKMLDKRAKAQASAQRSVSVRSANAQRTLNGGSATNTNTNTNKEKPPIPPTGGRRSGALTLNAWLEKVKAAGEDAIPESDPVFDYAEKAGIPIEFLRLAWLEFRGRYADETKRYTDWRSVYRKAVRGNWFKLWFAKDGAFELSTQGKQAQAFHADRRAA